MISSEPPSVMWALTSGEYSDYRVHAVCPTREIAEEIAGRVRAEGLDVDELPLLTSVDDILRIECHTIYINVRLDGTLGDFGPAWARMSSERGVSAYGQSHWGYVRINVSAGTSEAAAKAAREYGAEMGAELAAGVSVEDAVAAFNQRRIGAQP